MQSYIVKATLISFLFIFNFCNSQNTSGIIKENSVKNTIEFNETAMSYKYDCKDCIDIINLLKQYHYGYNSWDSINSAWDTVYYDNYTYLDQALRGEIYFFEKEPDLTANLIDITKNEDSTFVARILYTYTNKKSKLEFLAFYNFYVKRNKSGLLKLVPYLEYSKKQFKKTVHNGDEFYESLNKPFTKTDYEKITFCNDSIANFFNEERLKLKIFYTKSFVEAYKAIGFESYYRMNQNRIKSQSNAITDVINKVVYSPSVSLIKHELVHIYIFKSFGVNNNYWVGEGAATFLAGDLEPTLEIDLKKLSKDLKLHPENDFENIFQYENLNVDVKTNYMYTIFGMLCKLVYEKEGKQGLLDFVNSGSSEDAVYNAIEKHLGIKKNNVNFFLRTKIMGY